MIQIIEDTPIKVSGRTSIFIFCDSYNKDVVDAIKSLDLAVYHKKKNVWEIPVNFLSEILDKLTYLDEIKLILLADDKQLENKGKITISYKTNPFKHQEEAIIYGLENNDWLLLDSPGLGKTCSIIHLAEELKAQRGLKHCLIVCGIATLRSNWEKEIKIHSYLSSVIIGKKINSRGTVTWNTIAQRAEQLKNNIDEFFVIINVESLRDERVVDAINNSQNKFDMIVLDECHSCLSSDTLVETDIGKISISDIVNKKIMCKVKSYNTEKNKTEWKDIVNFFNNGLRETILKLTFVDDNGNNRIIKCTPDHLFLTKNRGYVQAIDLLPEDNIIDDCMLN